MLLTLAGLEGGGVLFGPGESGFQQGGFRFVAPPEGGFAWLLHGHLGAHDRGQQGDITFPGCGGGPLQRFKPVMQRQIECAVVDGEHGAALEIKMRLYALFRQHMHLAPQQVIGAGFDQGQVKGPQPFADFPEAPEVTAVATEEQVATLSLDRPAGPQGFIPVGKAAAGKMLGRCGGKLQAGNPVGLPPVQLDDLVVGNAPAAQVIAHFQRYQIGADLVVQRQQAVAIEVIIVVVADDHGGNGGQVVERKGQGVKPFRAGPLHW